MYIYSITLFNSIHIIIIIITSLLLFYYSYCCCYYLFTVFIFIYSYIGQVLQCRVSCQIPECTPSISNASHRGASVDEMIAEHAPLACLKTGP